jgi:hypothetical protein
MVKIIDSTILFELAEGAERTDDRCHSKSSSAITTRQYLEIRFDGRSCWRSNGKTVSTRCG